MSLSLNFIRDNFTLILKIMIIVNAKFAMMRVDVLLITL